MTAIPPESEAQYTMRRTIRTLCGLTATVLTLTFGVQTPASAAETVEALRGQPYVEQFEPGVYHGTDEAFDVAVSLLLKHGVTIAQCIGSVTSWFIPGLGVVKFVGNLRTIQRLNIQKIIAAGRAATAGNKAKILRTVSSTALGLTGRTCEATVRLGIAAAEIYRTAKEYGQVYYADRSTYVKRFALARNTCEIDIEVGRSRATAHSTPVSYNRCLGFY